MSILLSSVWPSTVEGWVGLISLIIGLIGAIVALVPTVIKLVKTAKELVKNRQWKKIIDIADAAMEAAEESKQSGEDKKAMVIAAVKAGCIEAQIELDEELLDNLSKYIDETINWYNIMKKASKKKK